MAKRKVQVWVYFQNPQTRVYSFLILKTRPERGGFWQPVTGGVEKDEGLPEAALREAQEETGIVFKEGPDPIAYQFEYQNHGEKFTEYGFAFYMKTLEEGSVPPSVKLDAKEHVEHKWVTGKEAFKTIAHPSNAAMLKVLLTQLAKQ